MEKKLHHLITQGGYGFVIFLQFLFTTQISSQCLNSAQFGTVTAPTNNTPVTITICAFGGEYNTINSAVAGSTYLFTGSGGTGNYLTIRQGTPGGAVLAFGFSPVTATCTVSGPLYVHINTSAACGTDGSCHTTTIQCTSCITPPPPCTNTTSFGSGVINTTGALVTISTCSFAGEYSTITGATNGQQLRLTSSGVGDVITVRSGSPTGPVLAFGASPLTYTNTFIGTIYAHWNKGPLCNSESVCRTTTIQCLNCPVFCNNTTSSGSATINTNGSVVTISSCSFAGEYSTINGAVAGQSLQFTSSVAGDIITVRSGTPGGPVVASGPTPLNFTNTFTGTLYAHWNTPGCGSAFVCRTTTVQCTNCVLPSCVAAPIFPTNGQIGICPINTYTLSWPASTGASGYDVYLGTNPTPPLVSSNQAATSFTTSTPTNNILMYWRIEPRNVNGPAIGCATWTYTVRDITPPTLSGVPINVTISCEAAIPAAPTVTAVDNCAPVPTITLATVSTKGTSAAACNFYNYTITRTWTATDAVANSIQGTQIITVQDLTAPTTTPAVLNPVTINCEQPVPAFPVITYADNCATGNLTVTNTTLSTKGTSPTACNFYNYTVTYTSTVRDPCLNTRVISQVITVQDVTKPVITTTNPVTFTLNCEDPIPAPSATVKDNCDPAPALTMTQSSTRGSDPFECSYYKYQITRIWNAVDKCSNTSQLIQTIKVQDITPPQIFNAPKNVTVECDELNNKVEIYAIDKCYTASNSGYAPYNFQCIYSNPPVGLCPGVSYVANLVWTFYDVCGNTSEAKQKVLITDATAPEITCPNNIVATSTNGSPVAVTWKAPIVWDLCDSKPKLSLTAGKPSGSTFPSGSINTIEYTAMDECGNKGKCAFTVTVEENSGNLSLDVQAPDCADIIVNEIYPSTTTLISPLKTNGATPYEKQYEMYASDLIMEEYGDGTAQLDLKLVQSTDKKSGWNIALKLVNHIKYAEYKDQGGIPPVVNMPDYYFSNWRFYGFDVNGSGIAGFGAFAGKSLEFSSTNNTINEGVQVGFHRDPSIHYHDVAISIPITEKEQPKGFFQCVIPANIKAVYSCNNVSAEVKGLLNPGATQVNWSNGGTGILNNTLCLGYHKVDVNTPDNKHYTLNTEILPPSNCKFKFPKEICEDQLDNNFNILIDNTDNSCLPLNGNGVTAYYYSSPSLTNLVKCGVMNTLDGKWGAALPIKPKINSAFGIEFLGDLTSNQSGPHTFIINADGETSVYFDDVLVWKTVNGNPAVPVEFVHDMVAGNLVHVKVVYKHYTGSAQAKFSWLPPQNSGKVVVPQMHWKSYPTPNCTSNIVFNQQNENQVDDFLFLSPNPAKEFIALQMTFKQAQEKVDIAVFDMLQRKVITQSMNVDGHFMETQLSLKNLATGTYLLILTPEHGEAIQSMFVKE